MNQFNPFRLGVVIPATESRLENLLLVLHHLKEQTEQAEEIIIVCDGWEQELQLDRQTTENLNIRVIHTRKHRPGYEQPRNLGVRRLSSSTNYCWFLDSDCIPSHNCIAEYRKAHNYASAIDRVLIGPYDWMKKGERELGGQLEMLDYRQPLFNQNDYKTIFQAKLNVGLACFGGNLVWPVREFKRVGGFWNELHMGRCEDGELGIRAVSMAVPMSVVPQARAYHLWHEVNHEWKIKANERDVPMINDRHPYMQGEGVFVVDYDGKRFNQICENCGDSINTIEIWRHECEN